MGHRFVEHVGEVEVELEAASEAGIFEAALEAFVELVDTEEKGEPTAREVEVTASERALLLVEWLSELVFLAEVERFAPERVAALELTDGHIRAKLIGHRGRPRHLVKAVTLSRLALGRDAGGWHGRVVLDV